MDIAVVVSLQDPAGLNIKEQMLKEGFEKEGVFRGQDFYSIVLKGRKIGLYTVANDSVHSENIDREIEAGLFVFATKHQSRAGIHSLSVHPIGNWGRADYGGRDRTLCPSPAAFIRQGFLALQENNPGGHEIIQEATHHGPYMEKPVMFMEIGSSQEQWENPANGKALARSILSAIQAEKKCTAALGIGGPHHSPNFRKLVTEDISLAHICPRHMLGNLDSQMLMQALEKSVPKAKIIALDWKGLGREKERIREMVKEAGVEVIRV